MKLGHLLTRKPFSGLPWILLPFVVQCFIMLNQNFPKNACLQKIHPVDL